MQVRASKVVCEAVILGFLTFLTFYGDVMWREDLDMSWDFESGLTLALGVVGFWLLLVGQLSDLVSLDEE